MTIEDKQLAQEEMYEQEAHSCFQCMYGEKNVNEMPCCECHSHSMFVNCRPYDEDIATKYDGWFEEVCGTCLQTRLVHDDMQTDPGNPGFICSKCQEELNRSQEHEEACKSETGVGCIECKPDCKYYSNCEGSN